MVSTSIYPYRNIIYALCIVNTYIKTRTRVGDGAPMVLVELVEMKEKEKKKGQEVKAKEDEKKVKAAS